MPKTMEEIKLLPCPYCGGKAEIVAFGDIACSNELCPVKPRVDKIVHMGEVMNNPIKAWNTRHKDEGKRTPRQCPKCSGWMEQTESERGDWLCPANHEGKVFFFDYELDMIASHSEIKLPEKELRILRQIVKRWQGQIDIQKSNPSHYKLYKKTIDEQQKEVEAIDLIAKMNGVRP